MQTTPNSTANTDAFQTSVTQIAKTAQKQKKVVFVIGSVILLVLIAVSFYFAKRSERVSAGKDAFYKARVTLEGELKSFQESLPKPAAPKQDPKAKTPPPPAAPASIAFVRFPVSAKLPQGIAALENVGQTYKGVLPGFEAYMLLGQTHLEHGAAKEDVQKASQYFEKAAEAAPSSEHAVAAYQGMAFSQEATGDHASAAKTFDRVVNYGNTPFQADAIRGLARNYELQGDTANAKIAYERLESSFPDSEDARFAKMKLAELAPTTAPKK